MASQSNRISMQLRRFLLIQNAFEDSTENDSDLSSRHLINTRLEVLECNWTKFQAEHDHICEEKPEQQHEEHPYIKNRTYERCQEFYVQARASLLSQQEEVETANPSSRGSSSSAPIQKPTTFRNTLPRIQIPKFAGDYASWRSFNDLFTSMVGNNSELTNVEKMHYLKTCLTGDASKLVNNIPVSDDSFNLAWGTLTTRYENKRILINAQLDKLLSLKPVRSKSARELGMLVSTVTESLGALKALGCNTNTWGPMLIYQLSRLLDTETREAWELKLGATSVYPEYKQFEEFLIGQSRAWESMEALKSGSTSGKYNSSRSFGKGNQQSRSLAAFTSDRSKDIICKCCKGKHFMSSCYKFLAMNAFNRKKFICKNNICLNCLGGHNITRCTNIKRCRKCGQRHHTLIHSGPTNPQSLPSATDTKDKKTENSTASNTITSSDK